MAGVPAATTPPPGWYPDPGGQGNRYWDGAAWTERTTPAAPGSIPTAPRAVRAAQPAAPARIGDWIGGILLSLLFPPIGLIAGIVYATKDDARRVVGIACIVLSSAMFLMSLMVLLGQSAGL